MPQTFKTLEISGKGPERSLERPFTDPEIPSRMTRICPAASKARLSSYARPPKGKSWPVFRRRHPYDSYMCFISSLLPTQPLNCQWRKRRWHSLLKYKMPKNPSQKSSQKPKNQCQGCSLARMRNKHSTFCIWHPKDHSQAGPKQPSALCASVRQPSEPVKCKEFPSEDWPPPRGPRAGGVRDTASSCPG